MMDRSYSTLAPGGVPVPNPSPPALRQPVSLEVPVRLQGEAMGHETFIEDTDTVLVFNEGAVLRVGGDVQPGQMLLLTNRNTRQQMRCRVSFVKHHGHVRGYAEVEFAGPAPGFWDGTAVAALLPSAAAPKPAPAASPLAPSPFAPAAREPEVLPFSALPNGPHAPGAAPAIAQAAASFVPNATPATRSEFASLPSLPPPAPLAPSQQPLAKREPQRAHALDADDDQIEKLLAIKRLESETRARVDAEAAGAPVVQLPNPLERAVLLPPRGLRRVARLAAAVAAVMALVAGASVGAWTLRAEESSAVLLAPATPPPPEWAVAGLFAKAGPLGPMPLRKVRTRELFPMMPPLSARAAEEIRRHFADGRMAAPAIARRMEIGASAAPDAPAGVEASAAPAAALALIPVVGNNAPAPPVVRESQLKPVRLIFSRPPVYPAMARKNRTEGEVVIHARVDETGKVTQMRVISGPATLHQAALDALQQWKYEPATLNGKPVAVDTAINIRFRL